MLLFEIGEKKDVCNSQQHNLGGLRRDELRSGDSWGQYQLLCPAFKLYSLINLVKSAETLCSNSCWEVRRTKNRQFLQGQETSSRMYSVPILQEGTSTSNVAAAVSQSLSSFSSRHDNS